MIRILRIALLSLVVATPLTAQLVNGQIYLLRHNESGKYLAASPERRLYMSTDTGASEQWQYRVLAPAQEELISYHGTVLFLDTNARRVFLAPNVARVQHNLNSYGHLAPRQFYEAFVIGSNTEFVMDYYPHYNSLVAYSRLDISPRQLNWTPIPVATPAEGRKAMEVAVTSGFFLRTVHGSHLTSGTSVKSETTDYFSAVQGAATPLGNGFNPTSYPVKYGAQIQIIERAGYLLQPSGVSNPPLAFVAQATTWTPANSWLVVDPSRVHKDGEVVAYGKTVALRHVGTNKFLSCSPPPQGGPYLTTNSSPAAWEYWTFVNP